MDTEEIQIREKIELLKKSINKIVWIWNAENHLKKYWSLGHLLEIKDDFGIVFINGELSNIYIFDIEPYEEWNSDD